MSTMRATTRRRARWAARAGAISVTALLATLAIWTFPVGSVAAAPPGLGAGSGEPPAPWAYGNLTTENVTWPAMHGMYEGYATYGFSVVLTQTNISATTYSLSENQTVGALINLTYCRPSCEKPIETEHYFYRAWETWNDVTNFSTAVFVTLRDGSSVGAVGIAGSSASSAANITEKLTTDRNGSVRLVDQLFANPSISSNPARNPALPSVGSTERRSATCVRPRSARRSEPRSTPRRVAIPLPERLPLLWPEPVRPCALADR